MIVDALLCVNKVWLILVLVRWGECWDLMVFGEVEEGLEKAVAMGPMVLKCGLVCVSNLVLSQ